MKKMKIVVFEDEPASATMVETMLVHSGHEVHVFPDPTLCPIYRDHGAQCPKNSPCADVLISDYQMPEMTGLEFFMLQRKRGCKALDQNKALVSGTSVNKSMRHDIEELGCHFIKKPFKMTELLDWVDECAQRLQDKGH